MKEFNPDLYISNKFSLKSNSLLFDNNSYITKPYRNIANFSTYIQQFFFLKLEQEKIKDNFRSEKSNIPSILVIIDNHLNMYFVNCNNIFNTNELDLNSKMLTNDELAIYNDNKFDLNPDFNLLDYIYLNDSISNRELITQIIINEIDNSFIINTNFFRLIIFKISIEFSNNEFKDKLEKVINPYLYDVDIILEKKMDEEVKVLKFSKNNIFFKKGKNLVRYNVIDNNTDVIYYDFVNSIFSIDESNYFILSNNKVMTLKVKEENYQINVIYETKSEDVSISNGFYYDDFLYFFIANSELRVIDISQKKKNFTVKLVIPKKFSAPNIQKILNVNNDLILALNNEEDEIYFIDKNKFKLMHKEVIYEEKFNFVIFDCYFFTFYISNNTVFSKSRIIYQKEVIHKSQLTDNCSNNTKIINLNNESDLKTTNPIINFSSELINQSESYYIDMTNKIELESEKKVNLINLKFQNLSKQIKSIKLTFLNLMKFNLSKLDIYKLAYQFLNFINFLLLEIDTILLEIQKISNYNFILQNIKVEEVIKIKELLQFYFYNINFKIGNNRLINMNKWLIDKLNYNNAIFYHRKLSIEIEEQSKYFIFCIL